jgi:hypothetical protein
MTCNITVSSIKKTHHTIDSIGLIKLFCIHLTVSSSHHLELRRNPPSSNTCLRLFTHANLRKTQTEVEAGSFLPFKQLKVHLKKNVLTDMVCCELKFYVVLGKHEWCCHDSCIVTNKCISAFSAGLSLSENIKRFWV